MKLTPDDPRLTAYALGELDEAEPKALEVELNESAECRRALEEIKQTVTRLTDELASEELPELDFARQRKVESKLRPASNQNESLPWWKTLFKQRITLVETLVVISITGILAGLFLPALSKAKSKASHLAASSALRQLALDREMIGNTSKLPEGFKTEAYSHITDNPFLAVAQNPLSTFSIDVDTASYAIVRRFLNEQQLPPKDAVRIEEMINYFTYNYPPPSSEHPFSVNVEVAGCPWNNEHRLARVALKGREVARDKRPPSNLVFLIDVSGSMQPANKLPLLKQCFRLLTHELTKEDRVSIVVYAGAAGEVLSATSGQDKKKILRALDKLEAGGSTHGSEGIQLAYKIASANFIKGGVNRVLLCTDGDFNIGITSPGDLVRLIEDTAKSGVFLSILGFGMGNYKDATVELLADKGNGNYAYIDTLNEGRKVLVEQMSGTLVTIAKDVKIQVEFNPAQVAGYRLIGYENRLLAKEDFNDDKKDAGEIGAGHTVTALYEIVPAGLPLPTAKVDPLKYQSTPELGVKTEWSSELMTVKLRYKEPDGDTSKLIEVPVTDGEQSYAPASEDFKFAASVASFGMVLRDSEYKGTSSLDGVRELAEEGKGRDESGYRAEFIQLVKQAKTLSAPSFK